MKDSDFRQLNIICTEHNRVWCYCIYHKDTVRPNLSISLLDKYYGKCKCWACGKGGQLSYAQMDKLLLSRSVVYKNNKANLQTMWVQFAESCHDNLQKFPLLKLGLVKELDVSIKSLDDWLVGYDGSSFTIPMFREDLPEYYRENGFCGIQRRFSDGSKRCVTGSRLGLMYATQYIESDGEIFICEGFSDGISVYDLGFNSLARPHCRYAEGIKDFFEDVLEGTQTVIIIPDNDTVGIEGAEKLQDKLEGIYDCIIFDFDGAKDIRKLIQLKGKDYVRKELGKYI